MSLLSQLILYLPLGISLLYLPLAHWLRSQALFGLWGVSFAVLFAISQSDWYLRGTDASWAIASALVLPPAVLWLYHSTLWAPQALRIRRLTASKQQPDPFQSIGQAISIWIVGLSLYGFSFRFWWSNNPFREIMPDQTDMPYSSLLSLILYLALAVYSGWRWFRTDRDRSQPRSQWLKTPVFAVMLVTIYGLGVAFAKGATLSIIGPVLINIMAFILSFILLYDGLRLGIRRRFWGGMTLLVLGLISRMFEYNTALIFKAIVLTACGLGIIAAGLWFEYQAKLSNQRTTVTEGAS